MISSTQPTYFKWIMLRFLSLELARHNWEKVAAMPLSHVFKFISPLCTWTWFPYAYIDWYDLPSQDGGLMKALTYSVMFAPLLISSCSVVEKHLVNSFCSIYVGYSRRLPSLCRWTSFRTLFGVFISSTYRLLPNTQLVCCLYYV